jgi:hypothetical protein
VTTPLSLSEVNGWVAVLLTCLGEQLATTAAGEPEMSLRIGEVEWDGGTSAPAAGGKPARPCGQGWVRMTQLFRSTQFPLPDQQVVPGAQCFDLWAVTFELGVLRCWPTMNARGKPEPLSAARMAAVQSVHDDVAAMAQAICCWSATMSDPPQFIVGDWQPLGPAGGMVGGTMVVTAQLEMCCNQGG